MQPPQTMNKRIDITACLEAVNMYDADYHRERDGNLDGCQQPEYVSVAEHVWAKVYKTSNSLLGYGFLALMGIAALLIVTNVVHSIGEYMAAQPTNPEPSPGSYASPPPRRPITGKLGVGQLRYLRNSVVDLWPELSSCHGIYSTVRGNHSGDSYQPCQHSGPACL